jgi:hypothetical protein
LNISKIGSGSGSITSNIPGLSCNAIQCIAHYLHNIIVTLTAIPSSDSNFTGWSGDCSSCGNTATCNVNMAGNVTCSAQFDIINSGSSYSPMVNLTIFKDGTGDGTVVSDDGGIVFGGGTVDCTETYSIGTYITLTATPDEGSAFAGWGYECDECGTDNNCSFIITKHTPCLATFNTVMTLSTIKNGTGSGNITSRDGKIDCGLDCSEDYANNTTLTLYVTPDSNSVFGGWGDDCAGCGIEQSCNITITEAMSCTAVFDEVPPAPPRPVPSGQTIGQCTGECLNSAPMRINGSIVELTFNYEAPVYVVAGFMDSALTTIYWVTEDNGSCTVSTSDFQMLLSNEQSISCRVSLPVNIATNGILFWFVSGTPVDTIDWFTASYLLQFYQF